MTHAALPAGLDPAAIDGSWYLDVQHVARETPWLHGALEGFSDYGFILFGLLLVGAWWTARTRSPRAMAAALWAPFALGLTYLLSNYVLKIAVAEPRPCRALEVVTVAGCDAPTDYSFPSNHSATAAAFAVSVLLVHRKIGVVLIGLALLMGFTRVYVGAHYPHDVLAGYLLGILVAGTGLLATRLLADPVENLRADPRWGWLVGPGDPATTRSQHTDARLG